MVQRHGRATSSARAGGCSSTCEHFFDGYKHDRGLRRQRSSSAAAEAGASVGVLCDTNGGMLPHGHRSRSSPTSRERSRRAAGHPLPGRHRLRGRQHGRRGGGRRDPRAVHGQRLRRAHRQRRSLRRRRQPRAQARHRRACPRARSPRRCAISHAIAEIANIAPNTHQPYVGVGVVRAQGGPACQRAQGQRRAVQPHRPGDRRQRHARARHGDGRARVDRAEGRASSATTCPSEPDVARPRGGAGQGARGARAGRSRPPTRRSSC